ncbi:hypothetical protein [Burkholderia singularis]|uniref:hypothetical protein n=1 Tax=Burkholderia singularis TaxID=1503053 RepID=UPI000841F009|nr:hypothetical protein [Burkholderia sp. Bp7605]AOK31994.1 hypothetical protein AQ611_21140 [Burkholderia sp. Bp7605]
MRTVARSFVIMIGGLRRPCVDFDQPSAATCAEMASLLAIAAGAGHGAGGPGPIGADWNRCRRETAQARYRIVRSPAMRGIPNRGCFFDRRSTCPLVQCTAPRDGLPPRATAPRTAAMRNAVKFPFS